MYVSELGAVYQLLKYKKKGSETSKERLVRLILEGMSRVGHKSNEDQVIRHLSTAIVQVELWEWDDFSKVSLKSSDGLPVLKEYPVVVGQYQDELFSIDGNKRITLWRSRQDTYNEGVFAVIRICIG